MKILVVGGGGREHAIIWKLSQSSKVTELYCAPGNGGIGELANCVDIEARDIENMVSFAKEKSIDLVIVTPDDPLALGMVDALSSILLPYILIPRLHQHPYMSISLSSPLPIIFGNPIYFHWIVTIKAS
jgi:phosphoribosylamine-glycine ligase